MNWETFWAGVEATGTLVAAAAVIVFWRADRRHHDRAEARRVVAAISDAYSLSPEDRAALPGGVDEHGAYLIVRNLAGAPIFDVYVEAVDAEAEPLHRDVLMPSDRAIVPTASALLAPGRNTSTAVRVTFSLDDRTWRIERDSLEQVDPAQIARQTKA